MGQRHPADNVFWTRNERKGTNVITKDGYRTTVEAGRTALARAGDLLWASTQNIWAQLKTLFRR